MAYMSQEKKREIAKELKAALKGSGLKYSLAVHNHSTLTMNIRSGPVDFFSEFAGETRTGAPRTYLQVNTYHYTRHFTGEGLRLLDIILPILNRGNWDKSDIMTDYFNVGWYVNINIGKWDKPYILTA